MASTEARRAAILNARTLLAFILRKNERVHGTERKPAACRLLVELHLQRRLGDVLEPQTRPASGRQRPE